MSDPKFQCGDVVRHRASREVGVVVSANKKCSEHKDHVMGIPVSGKKEECRYLFDGTYDLDLGFDRDRVTVDECLLERVSENQEADRD